MSAQLKIVDKDETTEFDKQLERIGRRDFVKKELTPPHFPDHPDLKKEVTHGTLRGWFSRLKKPEVPSNPNVEQSNK